MEASRVEGLVLSAAMRLQFSNVIAEMCGWFEKGKGKGSKIAWRIKGSEVRTAV